MGAIPDKPAERGGNKTKKIKKNENTNKGENEKNRSKRIKRNKPQNLDDITITVHNNNNKDHEG